MPFNARDKIIITIICSIVGFVSLALIIFFVLWFIIDHYRSKAHKCMNSNEENNSSPLSLYYRRPYRRSQQLPSMKMCFNNHNNNSNNIDRRNKKRRFNTNDSVLTLSFDPPHLINQNVKNLDKLLNSESTLTASSWCYEETLPRRNCYHKKSSNEPVYASSSTVLTAVSNLGVIPQNTNNVQLRLLNELDHVLRLKQKERSQHPLKYSQSCRQANDLLPFDYYRSISPPSTITGTTSSNNNSLEPIYVHPNKYSNATLMHKIRLAQLRDDTAVLY